MSPDGTDTVHWQYGDILSLKITLSSPRLYFLAHARTHCLLVLKIWSQFNWSWAGLMQRVEHLGETRLVLWGKCWLDEESVEDLVVIHIQSQMHIIWTIYCHQQNSDNLFRFYKTASNKLDISTRCIRHVRCTVLWNWLQKQRFSVRWNSLVGILMISVTVAFLHPMHLQLHYSVFIYSYNKL